jgi:hypothetical protein
VRGVSGLRKAADAAYSPRRFLPALDSAAAGAVPVGVSDLPEAQIAAAARTTRAANGAGKTDIAWWDSKNAVFDLKSRD